MINKNPIYLNRTKQSAIAERKENIKMLLTGIFHGAMIFIVVAITYNQF